MTTRGRVASAVALVLSLVVAGRAAAVSPAAEAAFQEGRRLLGTGQTAEACVKLAESFALDASSGTLINLALCHEKQEKLATAWAEYLDAVRLARDQGRPDRAEVANVKASLIEARVPKLTPTTTHPLPGLRVEIDQRTFGEGAPGVAVPIDPGLHQLTASAPGRSSAVDDGLRDRGERGSVQVEIPALEPKAPTARRLDPGTRNLSARGGTQGGAGRNRRDPPADGYRQAIVVDAGAGF